VNSICDLLSGIETKGLWAYFHKDWLLQIRAALRPQLPDVYHIFLESEAILVSPDAPGSRAVLPDVSLARPPATGTRVRADEGTTATVESEEAYEIFTQYTLLVRRSPENQVVAAVELLSPSNKGVNSLVDKEKFLRKRAAYLEAGINLLEVDALLSGDRVLPASLHDLAGYGRCAWTVFHGDGLRQLRGWGWNAADNPPRIPWLVESDVSALIDLASTAEEARQFNAWDQLLS
jgi:hypothetical protein